MLAKTSQDANAILISFKFQLQKYLGPLLLFIHCKKTLFGETFMVMLITSCQSTFRLLETCKTI